MDQIIKCTLSPNQHKWFLVLTNLSYLLPGGVTAYKIFQPPGQRMNAYSGTELISLFGFLTFFASWSYHQCRADLSITTGVDVCQTNPKTVDIPPCEVCPKNNTLSWVSELPGSTQPMNYQISRFIDHLFATFTIFMTIIHVLPIHDKIRKLCIILTLIWMVIFLSAGNEALALVPSLISFMVLIIFWYSIRRSGNKSNVFFSRNKTWVLALLSMTLAVSFFQWDDEPYWLKHSLWHILGAISAALLISKSADNYQDIDTAKFEIPYFLRSVLQDPTTCKLSDVTM